MLETEGIFPCAGKCLKCWKVERIFPCTYRMMFQMLGTELFFLVPENVLKVRD
jgi:hypothetical protein